MLPTPERARRPLPVMFVAPHCARLREADIVGAMRIVLPVHASRALRCVSFQSVVPSSWRMQKEVLVDCVDIRSEMGVVEVTR